MSPLYCITYAEVNKRLRGLLRPQYRLRVGEIRVYYDVADPVVEVLAIIRKSEAECWLTEEGEAQ